MELDFRRFEEPDETRVFEKGTFQVVTIGGMAIGRAEYEPGWRWSEHVGPTVGATSCQIEHLGFVVSGRATAAMDDGREFVMEPGQLFAIPPGHDSWVVGDKPYVSIHFLGAADYAAVHEEDRWPAIRAATIDDIEELARLRFQLYTEYTPSIAEPFDGYRERFVPFARDALADGERWRAWTVEEDARLVCAMWLQTVPRVPAPGRDDPRPIGYLTNAYVEPAFRGKGLGSAMLATVLEHCRSHGFELIVAWPADDAYGFYERAGFARPPDPVVRQLPR